MTWEHKAQSTPLDTQPPIDGLYFLDGDVLGQQYHQDWIRGRKYPLLTFPSGVERAIHHSGAEAAVHIFGALDVPQRGTRDVAYTRALAAAEEYEYQVATQGDDVLVVGNPYAGRRYHITYDNEAGQLVDITHFPEEAMELVDGQSRALLPPLYHNENIGLDAIAPVKLFTPDSGWSWFLSEFDGRDVAFGLAVGFAAELGYVSIAELEGVRGPLGLPVERDLYYEPRSLQELRSLYE